MTEPKPLKRLEPTDDGSYRVVAKSWSAIAERPDGGIRNALVREHEDFFVEAVPKKGGPTHVRVGTAAHAGDTEGWAIHGANGIVAEVPFEERDLGAAERAYCESTFLLRDVETVVEFEIPPPEDLRSAILDEDVGRFDCCTAIVTEHDHRHDVLTDLQESYAQETVRSNQLHPRTGIISDLDGVWRPDDEHNDGKTREHLYDMAAMRADAHLGDFRTVAGFPYYAFRSARSRVLGIHEDRLDPHDLCALDVAGYPDWTYCRECGAVGPPERFLDVELDELDRSRRCCDRCADMRADYEDGFHRWTPENVAAARDRRAQSIGEGQRRIEGEYGGENGGE